MFGRTRTTAATAARSALYDPDFSCRAPGVARMEVLYDPASWLRCPSVGHDRTKWRDRALTAYAEDLGWTSGDSRAEALAAALDRIADDDLSRSATFVHIPPSLQEPASLAWVNVFDEELTLLEHQDPERYLAFLDLDPDRPEKVRSFPGGWREASKFGTDCGALLIFKQAQRRVALDPLVYSTGGGFAATGKNSAEVLGVIVRTRLYDAAGKRL